MIQTEDVFITHGGSNLMSLLKTAYRPLEVVATMDSKLLFYLSKYLQGDFAEVSMAWELYKNVVILLLLSLTSMSNIFPSILQA